MKILYFYQYFTTPKGAWSTRSYEFARRWVEAGNDVTVVTTVYDKSDLDTDSLFETHTLEGIRLRIINLRITNKGGFLDRTIGFLAYAVLSCWYALREQADVVFASSGPLTVVIPALVAKWCRGIPMVLEVRDLWPDGAIELGILRNPFLIRIAKGLEALAYREAACVVPLSEGMRDRLEDRAPNLKTVTVPNAADTELFLPDFSRRREARKVMYTGSLGLMDDCAQIIDAAEVLRNRGRTDIEIVLIGEGEERPQLERLTKSRRLEAVTFEGLVPKTELALRLPTALCALITFQPTPILDTSSPNKLFDALAAGVPVVQTTQGWIKDLLDEWECGITVPPRNARAMADAIERLADAEDLRERMGRQARRVALEHFDRDLLAQRLLGVFRKVLSRSGSEENSEYAG